MAACGPIRRHALGNDPAYTSREAALGVATVGDTASIASAQALDKACAAG
jgi:hypothetical protein